MSSPISLAVVPLVVHLVCFAAVAASEAETPQWQGTWVTDLGVMELTESEGRYSGTYGRNGAVEGSLDGDRLTGTYRVGNASGKLEWTLAEDGSSFAGKWIRGGQSGVWRGWRKDPAAEEQPTADFAGMWLTSFGPLQLTQQDEHVTGTYGAEGWATVEGTVVGRRLQLDWKRLQWSGTAWLEQSPDGQRLFGATQATPPEVWLGVRVTGYPKHADAQPGKVVSGRADNGMLYHLRMPDGWKPGEQVDVVVLLHGSNWTTRGMVPVTAANWPEIAKRFAILGIEGQNWASWSDPDNLRFNYTYANWMGKSTYKGYPFTDRESPYLVMQVLEELQEVYSLERVLVGGHSQGGFLTSLLHMHFPDKLAGTFPMSGGLVMQAEPNVFDDAELQRAQRATPMAIVHGRRDPVVPFATGEYVYQRFTTYEFDRTIMLAPDAGHPYDFLPVGDAVDYLDAMSTTDQQRLVEYTQQQAEAKNWRVVGALLDRAPEVGEAEAQLEKARTEYEQAAQAKAGSLLQAIQANEDGQWVDEFHPWAEQFALSTAGAETMAAFAALRQEHNAAAEPLNTEALAALRKGDRETAKAKYQEIVDKYYASQFYAIAKARK